MFAGMRGRGAQTISTKFIGVYDMRVILIYV